MRASLLNRLQFHVGAVHEQLNARLDSTMMAIVTLGLVSQKP